MRGVLLEESLAIISLSQLLKHPSLRGYFIINLVFYYWEKPYLKAFASIWGIECSHLKSDWLFLDGLYFPGPFFAEGYSLSSMANCSSSSLVVSWTSLQPSGRKKRQHLSAFEKKRSLGEIRLGEGDKTYVPNCLSSGPALICCSFS